MSCEDIPSLLDIQNTKKHVDDFGRLMGTGTGTSTNGVTGQVRPTYNKVIEDLGFKPGSGDFTTGFTVMPGQRDIAWKNPSPPGDNNFYSWDGPIPPAGKFVPAGSTPETTGGVIAGAWRPRTDVTLREELAEDSGATLVNTIQPVPGALKRAVKDALRERISLLDFMDDPQRDAVYSGAGVDHQSAFTAAMAWLAGGGKTLHIPYGTYNFTDTFDAPIGSCVVIDSKATLKFTSTTLNVIRIRRGVMFHGNMAKLRMTNPAWDGIAVLFNGEDQFSLEEPCGGSGLDIDSATYKHGTCIHIEAVGPRHYVMFVNFTGWTFGYNMHYGFTFNCGSAGTSDPATWHWITSNTFSDVNSFAFHLISVTGLSVTPAEVGGNNLLNVHHQSYDEAGVPVYFSGGHHNTITGFIWDWNYANGSPILFEGGAEWNQVHTNVDTTVVSSSGGADAYRNKVFDHTGGETGQKVFRGTVQNEARTIFGKVGPGQYATSHYPDAPGNYFHHVNTGNEMSLRSGGNDPYTSFDIWSARSDGTLVVGAASENPTISVLRTAGTPNRSARATRVGTDGQAGDLYENASGVVVGSISVNASGVMYNTSSDYRLKESVLELKGSGDFIDALRPVSWAWKVDGSKGVGFIAHELQAVSPSSVSGEKDAVQEVNDENGNGTGVFVPLYQSVEYGSAEVIANLVAEVQSLRARLLSLGV